MICRFETPMGLNPALPNTDFASYMSPVGLVAATDIGQSRQVFLPGGRTDEIVVDEKDSFTPALANGLWDAKHNQIHLQDGNLFVESLRQVLLGVFERRSRPIANRMELRDQAILDTLQDDIFRLSIGKTLLITGAPGTGKTTVLIKRISQKTKVQFLTEEEKSGLSEAQLEFLFADVRSWILFSPSSLLKSYLKEALSRELLPAFDERVVVWDDFKMRMLRDDLRYLRVGEAGGYFTRSTTPLLKNHESSKMTGWAKEFVADLPRYLAADLLDDVKALDQKIHGVQQSLMSDASGFIRQAEVILKSASDSSEAVRADAERRASLLKTASASLNFICNLAERAFNLADLVGQQGNTAVWFIREGEFLLSQIDQFESRPLEGLDGAQTESVRALKRELKNFSAKLSVETVLEKLPQTYQRFRTFGARMSSFAETSAQLVSEKKLDHHELDVLLFAALTISRDVFGSQSSALVAGNSLFAKLTKNFKTVVGIDEATDFSALELACMRLIAHPRFNSVAIVGDPMQRLTDWGIQDLHELGALLTTPESFELNVSYRQSARLLKVATDLFRHSMHRQPPFKSAFLDDVADPQPLAVQTKDNTELARWLADRIVEIYQISGQQLPSIAVLAPNDEAVRAIESALSPLLEERGIDTTACYGGEVLGTESRVRIFNVRFIKGLEFEAVFFPYIDEMAAQEPRLVDKYLYVGLTRAKSFLGVTYKNNFPSELNSVRSHFSSDNWRHLVPSPQ
ncbi:MAG: hypothetical protein RLZZ350_1207 [Verrucomicrobiota bacterium]